MVLRDVVGISAELAVVPCSTCSGNVFVKWAGRWMLVGRKMDVGGLEYGCLKARGWMLVGPKMDVGGPEDDRPEDGCWWAGRWMFVGPKMDVGGPEDGVGWARRWSLVAR